MSREDEHDATPNQDDSHEASVGKSPTPQPASVSSAPPPVDHSQSMDETQRNAMRHHRPLAASRDGVVLANDQAVGVIDVPSGAAETKDLVHATDRRGGVHERRRQRGKMEDAKANFGRIDAAASSPQRHQTRTGKVSVQRPPKAGAASPLPRNTETLPKTKRSKGGYRTKGRNGESDDKMGADNNTMDPSGHSQGKSLKAGREQRKDKAGKRPVKARLGGDKDGDHHHGVLGHTETGGVNIGINEPSVATTETNLFTNGPMLAQDDSHHFPGATRVDGPDASMAQHESSTEVAVVTSQGQQSDEQTNLQQRNSSSRPFHIEAMLVQDDHGVSERDRLRIEEEMRQRMLLATTRAEVVRQPVGTNNADDDDKHDRDKAAERQEREAAAAAKKKKRRTVIFISLGVVVLLAMAVTIAVVVTMGLSSSSDGGDNGMNNNGGNNDDANNDGANGGDIAEQSPQPTGMLLEPTIPTSLPSPYPSAFPSVSSSTFCQSPFPLREFGNKAITKAEYAEAEILSLHAHCEMPSRTQDEKSGIWLQYRGEGMPVTAIVEDDFDVRVYAAGSPLGCDTITCELTAIYRNNLSRVAWLAEWRTMYYLFINRRSTVQWIDAMTFNLTLRDASTPEFAYGAILVPQSGRPLLGANHRGVPIDDGTVPACGTASLPQTPGVWYSVVGNGTEHVARSCMDGGLIAQITVLEVVGGSLGSGDATFVCVAGGEDTCFGSPSEGAVRWIAERAKTYYILVHGLTDQGEFELTLSRSAGDDERTPEGDFCTNAIDISDSIPEAIDGMPIDDGVDAPPIPVILEGATQDFQVPKECIVEKGFGTPIGLWYRASGKIGSLRLDVLRVEPEGGPDAAMTQLAILQDMPTPDSLSCNQLQCVNANCIGGCNFPADISEDIYIFVYGFQQSGLRTEVEFSVKQEF